MPDGYRSHGWTLVADKSGVWTPGVGDLGRRLSPAVTVVERVDDKPADVVVLGDAVAVDQNQFHRDVGEWLSRLDVEEKRFVEDSDRRRNDAARHATSLFAIHPLAFVQHVHLDVHVCTQYTLIVYGTSQKIC